ncbi:anaerobic C4-dicarboxylate transporter [Arsenophonus endosymbiont of Aphis craccivora]|uniref:anaerobic C4-dicarboxylate transporter n=1 Tax=Arsenophonus endosymbiont of Aphis craccivora TaxID=1231049 RepID=UPI0015DBE693|nr:anaerobic C4-dicarboxylate transporter [Arsenophonus endosymbiont of Aphis craccivora]QLK87490.1 anaerobic C4-dicarboxylate transporter [Arsenophonus endosymbiont of Aphis craccivora]
MLAVEFIIVLLAIFLGARLGSIGIGFAGGLGFLMLAILGVKPGTIHYDVISIIMAVIAAISAMQIAGGLDYLIDQTEKLLRKNPKYITILAPIVTYFLTLFAGTGNISLATLPVIAEVAKENGIKPCRPLSTAVVAAQIGITASPISAAVVYIASVMENPAMVSKPISLLAILLPATFLAILLMSFIISWCFDSKLANDRIYQQRLAAGLIELRGCQSKKIKAGPKKSVLFFLLGVICVVIYAMINSPSLGLIETPLMNTTNAILIIMLSVATFITLSCHVKTDAILNSSTFKAGMSACICILGVAWLGDTFVQTNMEWIKATAGQLIHDHSWMLAVIFFICSALLYSQAATAKALMPMALALNVSRLTAIASFAAVSGLFVLPTYPTLVAAVQMDDTRKTRICRFVFNHPFFIPGTIGVCLSVLFGFLFGSIIL